MKSYKDKFLAAIKETMEMHREIVNGEREKLPCTYNSCPVCVVYKGSEGAGACTGCPLNNKENNQDGCEDFLSFPYRSYPDWSGVDRGIEKNDNTIKEASANRLLFWKKVIPILKNTPAIKFTPKGWEYFYELERWW